MVHDVTVKNGRKFECIKEEFCLLVCAYFSPTRFSPSISVDIEQIDQSISDKIRNANNALLQYYSFQFLKQSPLFFLTIKFYSSVTTWSRMNGTISWPGFGHCSTSVESQVVSLLSAALGSPLESMRHSRVAPKSGNCVRGHN